MTPPPIDPDSLGVTIVGPGGSRIALLHIERAYSGHGTWATVHSWAHAATRSEVSAADTQALLGAPAVCFALHAAGATTPALRIRLALLDTHLTRLARGVQAANARIDV